MENERYYTLKTSYLGSFARSEWVFGQDFLVASYERADGRKCLLIVLASLRFLAISFRLRASVLQPLISCNLLRYVSSLSDSHVTILTPTPKCNLLCTDEVSCFRGSSLNFPSISSSQFCTLAENTEAPKVLWVHFVVCSIRHLHLEASMNVPTSS